MCAACDSYLVGNVGPFILPVPQDHTTYWAGGFRVRVVIR